MKIECLHTTDYCSMAIENCILLEKLHLESMMEIMDLERDFIESCLEMGQVMTEALDGVEVEVTKKRGIFKRILDALNALFGKFKQKVLILIDKNEQWLKENLIYITPENVSKLGEVEIMPYWRLNLEKVDTDLTNMVKKLITKTKNNPEKYADNEDLVKIVRETVGGNSDLASDVKNFLRTGRANAPAAKPEKVTGKQLSANLKPMTQYVLEYDKYTQAGIREFNRAVESFVKSIQTSYNLESFCYLENADYSVTEIGLLPNLEILTEAGKDQELKNGKINDNKQNNSTTKVTVNSVVGDKESEGNNKVNSDKITQYCKNITNIFKILEGALLTVLEEIYLTFVNLFKAVVNAIKPEKDKDGDKDDDKGKDTDNKKGKKEKPKKK